MIPRLVLGPEREIAPATRIVRVNGTNAAMAASNDGFLVVWHSWEANTAFATRLDAEGRPLDAVGTPLPASMYVAAAAWTGSQFAIAAARRASSKPWPGQATSPSPSTAACCC